MESQKNWEYMHTEEYIKEEEREGKEWYWNNREAEKRYISEIEQRLESGTKEDREKLLALFRDRNFTETYKSRNELAYMIVIMQIYEREVQSEEARTILDMGRGIQEIRSKLLQLKFILWKIEFAKDIRVKDLLMEFIEKNQATPDMIQYMIFTAVCHKEEVLVELTDIFIEKKKLRYAFRMLEYLNELHPGNEEVLCTLAKLCGCVGNRQRAGEYLDQIKNPGKLAEGIRRKYEC